MSIRSSGSQTVCNVHPLRRPSHLKSNLSFTLSLSFPSAFKTPALNQRTTEDHSVSLQRVANKTALLVDSAELPEKTRLFCRDQANRQHEGFLLEVHMQTQPLKELQDRVADSAETCQETNTFILSFSMTIFNAHRELVWFAFTCLRIITKIKSCRNAKILTLTKNLETDNIHRMLTVMTNLLMCL